MVKPAHAWAFTGAVVLAAAATTLGLASRPPPISHTSLHLSPRTVEMPGFGRDQLLGPSEIEDLTEFVLALSMRSTDNAAVLRALPLYERNCAACHGLAGEGEAMTGVPDLTDGVWINGGAREEIRTQIWHGADGRGPPRQVRSSPAPRLR
ncbi:c-type cytochrome [Phenylobacterium sp.]|uniref:c-type cytochrome n=1 Tax=Phenylobacterium sp. TaxID=1871053 RepID=UPI0027374B41|nr:c-type cytochrome [Phenylobacterium sp.]MDP3852422.1 c-type cytochrome [Phenylobacterium sp.]